MLTTATKVIAAFISIGVSVAAAEVRLNGAGATFPDPLYQRWVTEYQKLNPDVKIDYQGIGSGGGIKGITEKTLDFAGSDAPMSKKEKEAAGGEILHIPTCAGAVVPAYNLPDYKGELKLDGETLAQIFMGKVTKWNDPKIAALNEGASLPDLSITPVSRTDGSGTNFVFTNYLATQSEEFKSTIGVGKQVKWPAGQGGKGNPGVTAAVQGTPGALGYVELNYATANKIPYASVKNKAGKFVKATTESVAAAGTNAVDKMTAPGKLAVDLWNQPGDETYPIAAFTYILVYKDLDYLKDEAKAKALVGFMNWATTDGEKIAPELDYAPLSQAVQAKAAEAIKALTWNGNAVAAAK